MAKERATVRRLSPLNGKCVEMIMEIDPIDYQKWVDGALIQDALPYLTADEREFLMTGITPDQWKRMFNNTGD